MEQVVKLLNQNLIYYMIVKGQIYIDLENWAKVKGLLKSNRITYCNLAYVDNYQHATFKLLA